MAGSQQQHVDIFRKNALRQHLLSHAMPGAVYVPFIGDGDLAVTHFSGRMIYGADLEQQRVAIARSRLPKADIRQADCDSFPFADVKAPFAIADFDAYCNPYKSLVAFWKSARKCKRIVLFGTDGLRQTIARKRKRILSLPAADAADAAEYRQQLNFWWAKYVLPFLAETVAPYRIGPTMFYLRRHMLYWGIVAER